MTGYAHTVFSEDEFYKDSIFSQLASSCTKYIYKHIHKIDTPHRHNQKVL